MSVALGMIIVFLAMLAVHFLLHLPIFAGEWLPAHILIWVFGAVVFATGITSLAGFELFSAILSFVAILMTLGIVGRFVTTVLRYNKVLKND